MGTSEKQIELNDGVGTYSQIELKGSAEDLELLISKLKSEGHSFIEIPETSEDVISPMAAMSGTWRGTVCDKSFDKLWMCNYPIINAALRAGGLTGASFTGNITSQITGPADVYTSMITTPRLKVVGYGLTGRDSFVVGTYEFKSSNPGTLVSWDFSEIASGVFVYVEFFGGADYSFKEYGIARSRTVWAPLEKE